MHAAMRAGLAEVGAVVREEAVKLFGDFGGDEVSEGVHASHVATAEGFKERVRTAGAVEVEQSKPRTTGQHPEYGDEMMKKGLLPARTRKIGAASEILEREVVGVLRERGLT